MSTKRSPLINSPLRVVLLLDGYIREIQSKLIKHKIIPSSINELCLKFYFYSKLLFCITSNHTKNTVKVQIADFHSNQDEKCIVTKDFDDISAQSKWSVFLSGMYVTDKFTTIPTSYSKQFNPHSTKTIFKCCGYTQGPSKECDAFLINTDSWDIQRWKLPEFPAPLSMAYSMTVGYFPASNALIAACQGQKCYGLFFDELKWKELANMTIRRYNPSSVVVDDKLFVVGGSRVQMKPELYDVKKNKWQILASCKVGRIAPGICYDESTRRVYVTGGFTATGQEDHEKTVEIYDFAKDEWKMDLPEMGNKYKGHPVTWMEGDNLLYVASIPSTVDSMRKESCEFIDLRICKKWEMIYEDKMVHDIFGIVPENSVQSYLLMH